MEMFPLISKEFEAGLHEENVYLFLGLSWPAEVRRNPCVFHVCPTFCAFINGFLIASNGQTIIFKLPANFWSIVSNLWALWADAEAAVKLRASVAFTSQEM